MHPPRNLVLLTTSTAVLFMRSGVWLGWFFQKTTMISFVLSTSRMWLLILHKPIDCSTVLPLVLLYQADHCCVICKLHKVFGDSSGDAGMCQQVEQQRALDTALGGA